MSALPNLDQIRAALPLPDATACVFVSGSIVLGWAHAASDLDIYAVAGEHPPATPSERKQASSGTPVPLHSAWVDGQRWDLEVWDPAQVDHAVSGAVATAELTDDEWELVIRIWIGRAVSGPEWLDERQAVLRDGGLTTTLARRHLHKAGQYLDAAEGLLDSEDLPAATLAVQQALGLLADGLGALAGALAASPKWRRRKAETARASGFDVETWWALVTMRRYDDEHPRGWVDEAVGWTRRQLLRAREDSNL